MWSARSRDVAAMRLLLDRGADLQRQSANGATALMFAATPARGAGGGASESATLEAIALCLDRGAEVNAVNALGRRLCIWPVRPASQTRSSGCWCREERIGRSGTSRAARH